MELPAFRLIGEVKKVKTHRQDCTNYYQFYALLSAPRKRLRAPCCRDFLASKQNAIAFVRAHVRKSLARENPIVACEGFTLERFVAIYRESLESDGNTTKHVSVTISRINRVCEGLLWKRISDVDGLKLKSWLAKQKGISETTRGYYARSFKSFTKFLADNRKIERDPLAFFKIHQKGDKPKPKRIRRALSVDELKRLIDAAQKGGIVSGLDGPQRAWLYRLAAGSVGFRAHEMASLTRDSVSLDEGVILLERTVSKRRRYDSVPIHPTLLDDLRVWLADKKPSEKLWPGFWWRRAAEMLRWDMAVAGIATTDAKGRIVDFHALRTTFITHLVGTAIPTSLVQRVARLSSPTLLNSYYSPHDTAKTEAIASMPALT